MKSLFKSSLVHRESQHLSFLSVSPPVILWVAKLIGDFGKSEIITLHDAKRMLTFCSTSGPLFMLGAVGAGMLSSPAAGAVIALISLLRSTPKWVCYIGCFLSENLWTIIKP